MCVSVCVYCYYLVCILFHVYNIELKTILHLYTILFLLFTHIHVQLSPPPSSSLNIYSVYYIHIYHCHSRNSHHRIYFIHYTYLRYIIYTHTYYIHYTYHTYYYYYIHIHIPMPSYIEVSLVEAAPAYYHQILITGKIYTNNKL